MAADDEVTLLRRVAGKDRKAFAALYQRYYGRLFAYLLRLTRRADRVEEVLQETLLAVWREAAAFDGERSRPAAWILGIAYREALPLLPAPLPPRPGEADLEEAAAAPSPHPVQLTRLLKRVEAAEREEPPPTPLRDRLRAWGRSLARLAAWLGRTPVFVRGMIAAQLAVLLLLAGAFAALRSTPEPLPEPARARVRVVFFPGVTEGEIRTALLEAGARFVDGPSREGEYILELNASPEAAEPALSRLRTWAEVRSLEPVPPSTAPSPPSR